MLDAIQCIQAEGIKTALLTNNWKFYPHNSCPPVDYVRHFFDVVVESYKVKMRKPNKDIFQHTLGLLDVAPQDAIFLDDLGPNLKGASELGIRTIKVTDQKEALRELEGQIGFELKGYAPGTVAVPDRLKIPVDRLHDYFKSALNIHSNVLTFVGSVLGTPFYIMEHVEGRIFKDQTLPGMSPVERRQVYAAMVEVLAKIHRVNFEGCWFG
ncbi:hypothetical protein NP493_531g03000 [Ridgeia piscesae]|uniref:Aminoglycoside phosphotransferase domain-containing protein n=1 Tax=Ridgeia piscesae TaxID=27915 RepID=A0AAD9KW51_RIDPI|nr:hypothetical protein NP493_531g03000 [Ridgeia piscesae]